MRQFGSRTVQGQAVAKAHLELMRADIGDAASPEIQKRAGVLHSVFRQSMFGLVTFESLPGRVFACSHFVASVAKPGLDRAGSIRHGHTVQITECECSDIGVDGLCTGGSCKELDRLGRTGRGSQTMLEKEAEIDRGFHVTKLHGLFEPCDRARIVSATPEALGIDVTEIGCRLDMAQGFRSF